jgi:hypothetical protein
VEDEVQIGSGRGGHRGRHGALDERGVGEPGAVAVVVEHRADGQDRAAEVAQDHDAVAALRRVDGGPHAGAVGAQPAVHVAARRLDPHVRPGHLPGQLGGARRDLTAMRDDDDPDHALTPSRFVVPGWSLKYRSRFDNAES